MISIKQGERDNLSKELAAVKKFCNKIKVAASSRGRIRCEGKRTHNHNETLASIQSSIGKQRMPKETLKHHDAEGTNLRLRKLKMIQEKLDRLVMLETTSARLVKEKDAANKRR